MNKRGFLRVNALTVVLWLGLFVTPAWPDTVQVNGFEMHYEVIGDGEPLLLLHGFNGSGAGCRNSP